MDFFKRSRKRESHQAPPTTTTAAVKSDSSANDTQEVGARFAVESRDGTRGGGEGVRSPAAAATAAGAGQSAEQCIALIDYDALGEDEISFRAGDVICVTGKGTASGYWEGYVAIPAIPALASVDWADTEQDGATSSRLLSAVTGGTGTTETTVAASSPPPSTPATPQAAPSRQPQRQAPSRTPGLFPNCLVSSNVRFKYSMAAPPFQNVALCLYTYEATGDGEISFMAGDVLTAVRPSTSPGWWYGVKSRGPAWTAPRSSAPAAAVETSSSTQPRAEDGAEEEHLFPTNFVTCDVVLVNFNFAGRQVHELSCKAGDIIQVHRRWNDGWWEGSLRGRRGIFPSNYTTPNVSTAPPLFCPRCRTIFPTNLFNATCATCTAEERVEDAMTRAMEAYVRGEAPAYDLFANVDVGVPRAPGASSADDDKDSDAEADRGSRATTSSDGRLPASGSSRPQGRRARRGGAPEGTRVPLLTEKDLADLASNRVKLME